MELELYELEFHTKYIYIYIYFFSSLIGHNLILSQSKLDFIKIEFQNKGIYLNSFKTGTYCFFFFFFFFLNKGKMLEPTGKKKNEEQLNKQKKEKINKFNK